jgi:hypothetical protein
MRFGSKRFEMKPTFWQSPSLLAQPRKPALAIDREDFAGFGKVSETAAFRSAVLEPRTSGTTIGM